MKNIYFLIFVLCSYNLFSQTITSTLNSGAISNSNYMHSIGEIYVINSNIDQNNSGIIAISAQTSGNTLSSNESRINDYITLFPNPTNDALNIKFKNSEKPDYIYIYNSIGQKVIEFKVNTENLIINLTSITEGLYFLRFSNNISKSYKIIKK